MLKSLLNRFLPPAPPASTVVATPSATAALLQVPVGDVAGADALIVQGNALEDAGEFAQAESLYRRAAELAPGHARAHLNLGIALAAQGDSAGAERAYEACLAIAPDHPFGNYNFARLALLRGEFPRAESLVEAALRARPEFPQALQLKSSILDALGRHEPAIAAIQAALRLQPDDSGGWFNLGAMLRQRARPDEAEDALRRALAGDPDNFAASRMLANVLCEQGFADEALAALEASAALQAPAWPERSLELLLSLYCDRFSAEEIFRRHRRFGADLEQAHPARFEHGQRPHEPARRLRVGYLSGDFLLHPVSFFLLPVLERHDHAQVEVFCYSFTDGGDKMTARLRELSDHWREVGAMTDDAIADAVHADGIDVLVDLAGHTGKPPRLAVFAQRPAPVQVSWLGYICTTGLGRIDHRLTDRFADPMEIAGPQHTERLQYLPASQWCYESLVHEPITPGAPFERRGHITFGSFNAALKITEAACRRWGELMARVPRSRLLVANIKSTRKREAILRAIAAAGVDAGRVSFAARVPLDQYLALYNSVDIALDSFPYGGGTTTLDAIYMGVPVAAAVGERSVSRSAASVLQTLGLEDWIAPSVDGWVDMVVARAGDHEALRALRAELRQRLLGSPLADVPRFVRDLEAAYRAMCEAAGTALSALRP
jgi:predicted O-linked N-acetylglucosamine transferase (SPINDLY family)